MNDINEINLENNRKKNIKKNIPFIIIIIIIIVLTVIFFKMQSSNNVYIILDNNRIIEYENKKYKFTEKKDYEKSKYKVFYQNDYIGSYFISKVDSFTGEVFFTSINSENYYIFDKPLLAISDNVNYIEYQNENFLESDITIFNDISNKDYIKKLSDLIYTSKITLDFDNDGTLETIYIVTYESIDDNENDEIINQNNYSVIFYVKNNQTYLIKEGIPYYEEENIVFPNYRIRSIIDINNDNIYEIIIANMMYDEPIYEIYELNNNKYEMVFSTTIGR